MAVTDADQLSEIVWRVVDDDTFTSGLWSVEEVAGYFNQRQNRFNRDTALMLAHLPIACTAGTAIYDLPQDWIATVRATWRTLAGFTTPVGRSDRYAASLGIQAYNSPTVPTIFDDQAAGTLQIQTFPPPSADGTLEILYASVLEVLHFDPDAPDIFDIPDDFVPYITYGVLADMLSKDGRGQDLARAKYGEARYQEGVAVAAILLAGFL